MELRDVVDGTSSTGSLEAEINDGGGGGGGGSSVTLHSHLKRRESVARMTWDGLSYLASAVSRLRQPGSTSYDHHDVRSRSVPSTMNMRIRSETTSAAPIAQPSTSLPPDVTMDTGGTTNMAADSLEDEVFFDSPPPPYEDVVDAGRGVPPSQRHPPPHRVGPPTTHQRELTTDPRYFFIRLCWGLRLFSHRPFFTNYSSRKIPVTFLENVSSHLIFKPECHFCVAPSMTQLNQIQQLQLKS